MLPDTSRPTPTTLPAPTPRALPLAPAYAVAAVELQLGVLADALRRRDGPAVAACATEVHRSLAIALRCLSLAASDGGTAELAVAGLRPRLVAARASLLAQRDAIARSGASLQRALDVMFPASPDAALYGVQGLADRTRSTGSARA